MLASIKLLIAAGLYFSITQVFGDELGDAAAGLAVLATIAWLWISEALHVSVTALLVPLLAGLGGVMAFNQALLNFADPVIFLFVGGFALAAGLQRQGLDRWMANQVLRRAGSDFRRAVLWLFWLTAFLSMWISNTATAAMMLPLALGLLSSVSIERNRATYTYVLLGIAFSANIGGIGTLVGSPPNAIAASNVGISFAGWLLWGIPLVLVLMPLMEIALRRALKPQLDFAVLPAQGVVSWGAGQTRMIVLFCGVVLLWVFGAPFGAALGFKTGYDAAVAVLALVLLHALRLASWRDIEKGTDWGVLLLFGGGLTLSDVLARSGAAAWLAAQLGGPLATLPVVVCLGLMVLFALILTEFTSNTASAALLIPLFLGLAPQINGTPLAVLVAVGTSCAFLLPVATPPNAIVFGSGRVPQRAMIYGGAWVTMFVYPVLFAAGALALAFH